MGIGIIIFVFSVIVIGYSNSNSSDIDKKYESNSQNVQTVTDTPEVQTVTESDPKISMPKCDGISVCVKDGDFLKYKAYSVTRNQFGCCPNGNLTYSFGKKISDDEIELNIKFETPKNQIYTSNGIMNLKTGFLEEFSISPESHNAFPMNLLPFMFQGISATSSSYEDLSIYGSTVKIEEQVRNDRKIIHIRTYENNPSVITIDKETRIVTFVSLQDTFSTSTHYMYSLIDTNTVLKLD